jgi:RecA/RadA recombinase
VDRALGVGGVALRFYSSVRMRVARKGNLDSRGRFLYAEHRLRQFVRQSR